MAQLRDIKRRTLSLSHWFTFDFDCCLDETLNGRILDHDVGHYLPCSKAQRTT